MVEKGSDLEGWEIHLYLDVRDKETLIPINWTRIGVSLTMIYPRLVRIFGRDSSKPNPKSTSGSRISRNASMEKNRMRMRDIQQAIVKVSRRQDTTVEGVAKIDAVEIGRDTMPTLVSLETTSAHWS